MAQTPQGASFHHKFNNIQIYNLFNKLVHKTMHKTHRKNVNLAIKEGNNFHFFFLSLSYVNWKDA